MPVIMCTPMWSEGVLRCSFVDGSSGINKRVLFDEDCALGGFSRVQVYAPVGLCVFGPYSPVCTYVLNKASS